MADDEPSDFFGISDAALQNFIDSSSAATQPPVSAPAEIHSDPSNDLSPNDDVPQSFFNSSNWDFQSSPSLDTYDASTSIPAANPAITTSAPPQSTFGASWTPFSAGQLPPTSDLGHVTPTGVDPSSVFGAPPQNASRAPFGPSRPIKQARGHGASQVVTALSPAAQEQLRNIAMPPHLQYNSPKSASSPDSATGERKVRKLSSSDGDPALKKRKMSDGEDEDEEEDEDGKPVKKTSHNMIEKRYRTNLNDKIAALRDSVPSLRIMSKSARGLDTTGDREELHGLTPAHKLNKATVLSKATEYIRHLEKRNNSLLEENSAMSARIAAFEKLFMAGAMNGSINPLQYQQQPPTPMLYSQDVRQQQFSQSPQGTPGVEQATPPAGMIHVPEEMQRIIAAQMAVNQPYAVPQQQFRPTNPTLIRQQQIQQQQQSPQNGWGKAAPYFGKLMVGSLAGLMVLEAVREEEVSNEKPEGRGLFALPVHMLLKMATSMDTHVMGFHFHSSLKLLLLLGTFLWVFVPSLFAKSEKPSEKAMAALQPAPSLASSLRVRQQAWLTAIQTVWVPRHNFFLEAAALLLKTLKLSVRNTMGPEYYQMLTGLTEEQESARVKAWTTALDSQLLGGDVEVNKSRLVLTLLASGTLPDTPMRLMLKSLHIRVLLKGFGSKGLSGATRAVAAKLARSRWNDACQLNRLLIQHYRDSEEQHDDELPEHLALLGQQDCDDVLTDEVVQRASNLVFNKETAYKTTTVIDGMDAVVEDSAIGSPMDAVAAWWSTQKLHDILIASLDKDEAALETRSTDLNIAVKVAPVGSVARVRAAIAYATLLEKSRGEHIAVAIDALKSLQPDLIESPLSHSQNANVEISEQEQDLRLALCAGMAVAHLRRGIASHDSAQEALRLMNMVFTAQTASSLSLLRCAAAMVMVEAYFDSKASIDTFGTSLERITGSLRLWIGGSPGDKCGLPSDVRQTVVERCIGISKSLVGMGSDTGYGSQSEDDEERIIASQHI